MEPRPNRLAWLWIALCAVAAVSFFSLHSRRAMVWYGDAFGYYVYLPSAFIYHNLDSVDKVPADSTFPYSVTSSYASLGTPEQTTPTGHVLVQYTCGVAVAQLPFFLAAHAYETLTHGNANGYSGSYEAAVRIGSAVYALLGLLLTYRLLRRLYGPPLAGLTACLLFLGTNLFFFAVHQPGMAHPPLFFLYALLLHATVAFYRTPTAGRAAAIGAVIGFMMLIRPTELLAALIPVTYGLGWGGVSVAARVRFLLRQAPKIMLAGIIGGLCLIPQLLYWKALSGKWIYDSYGSWQAFDWKHPHFFDGLLSGQNGWLAYSPLLGLSVAGFFLPRRYRTWAVPLLVVFPLYCYVIYCWWCPNYPNGLGSRPMIHLYALLALPLAAALQWIGQRPVPVRATAAVLVLLALAVNLGFSVQQARGILQSENSTGMYNLSVVFKKHISYNDLALRDSRQWQPDTTRLTRVAVLGCLTWDDTAATDGEGLRPDTARGSGYVVRLKESEKLRHPVAVVYDRAVFGDARWLKCSGRFLCPEWPGWWRQSIALYAKRGPDVVWDTYCTINNKINVPASPAADTGSNLLRMDRFRLNEWGRVHCFFRIPSKRVQYGDTLQLNMVNGLHQELFMDDFCLELYR